jgi:hypothetical protein
MTKQNIAPQNLADTDLDTISGGPHFKIWTGDIYAASDEPRQKLGKAGIFGR